MTLQFDDVTVKSIYTEESEAQSTNSFFQVVVLYFLLSGNYTLTISQSKATLSLCMILVLALRFHGHTAEFTVLGAICHSNSVHGFRGSSCTKLARHYKHNLFPIFSILELDCFPKTQRQRLRKNYNDQLGLENFLTSSVEVTWNKVYIFP